MEFGKRGNELSKGENMNLKTIFHQQECSSILRVKHKLGALIRKDRGIHDVDEFNKT